MQVQTSNKGGCGGLLSTIILVAALVGAGAALDTGGLSRAEPALLREPVSGAAYYQQVARQEALANGLPVDLFLAQVAQESGWNPYAVSRAGARGLCQFMPATAAGLGINPDNPVDCLKGMARLMARYLARYGDYAKALAAYNCGSGCTNAAIARCGANWRACVPTETQRYIRAIMGG